MGLRLGRRTVTGVTAALAGLDMLASQAGPKAALVAATALAVAVLTATLGQARGATGVRRVAWAGLSMPVALLAFAPVAPVLAEPAAGLVAVAVLAAGFVPAPTGTRLRLAADGVLAGIGCCVLASVTTLPLPPVAVLAAAVGICVMVRCGYPNGAPARLGWPLAAVALVAAACTGSPTLGPLAGLLAVVAAQADGERRDAPDRLPWRAAVAAAATVVPVAAAVATGLRDHASQRPAPTPAGAVGVLVLLVLARLALALADDLRSRATLDVRVAEQTMALVQQEQWFRSLVQNSSDVITVVDGRGVVRYQSPSVLSVFGHDPHQVVGTPVTRLLKAADAVTVTGTLTELARRPRSTQRIECQMRHADGSWRDTETIVASLVDDPHIRGLVLNTRDVTERKRLEAELTSAAFTDSLTGLANRALFRDRVERALERRAVGTTEPVVVVFCDLDGFKAVNDAQGHAVGDQLLGLVAERIRHCVRPGDTVARLGGDEFAVLLTGVDADAAAVTVAQRVTSVLAQPFLLDGREIYVGTSAGIASTGCGADTAELLLRNADLAMYRAKAAGDVDYVRFEPAMHDALLTRVALEGDLRQALARGQFAVHYQPTVDLRTGRVIGAEALLRWYHPERGVVPTEEFVALAEASGLIVPIGEWVLRECLRQGALWQSYAAPGEVFHVAVNISGRQLQPALVEAVSRALAHSGLPASALVLEMTESVLIERTDDIVALLGQLKALGISIAIDDFGTGYSSLSYLSRLPVDVLKIDRSFVEKVGATQSQENELTRTIVSLGKTLRLVTVAEGIERGEQLAELRAMGCTLGQGFLFSRPMPAAALGELLALRSDTVPAARRPLQPV